MEWVIEIKVNRTRMFVLIVLIILMTASYVIMVPHPLKTPNDEPNDDETYFAPDTQLNRQTRAGTSWPMHLKNPAHTSYTLDTGPTTNEVLWNNSTGASGTQTYGSPAVVDSMVYIGGGNGMNAFYANNGTLKWRTNTITSVPGGCGLTSSPAVDNGYVFFGGDRLYCLWASNGSIKWTIPTTAGSGASWGDGTPTVANGKVFIPADDRKLYCIEQDTGNVLWTFQTQNNFGSNYGLFAPPAVVNGLVYLAACDNNLYQINESQPTSIATANHTFTMAYHSYSAPVVANGRVFVGCGYTGTSSNNRFYCLDASDLSFIWEFYPGSATSFFSSAGFHNNRIYIGSVNNNLYCLDAMSGGPSTTVYWQYNIGGTWSSPAITNDRLYIGSKDNYIYCINLSQSPGSEDFYWRYNTWGDVDSSPAVSDGKVYVGSQGLGGRIYCLGSSAVPTLDYIIIRTAPDGGGSWVGDSLFLKGDADTFYAAGYNDSTGWIEDVPALWYSDNPSIGYVAPGPSNSTLFNALNHGTCNITVEYGGFLNTTGVLTIFNYAILKQGWNLISIPPTQSNTSLNSVLQSIQGKYDAVQWYDITDGNDPWKHYKVGKYSRNDLTKINETMGFWIHITPPGDTIFIYNGIQPTANQTIALNKGWNQVGYPSLRNRNAIEALNNIDFHTEVEAIWTYNATTQKWKKLSESDFFEMGSGYWIYSLVEETWDVPL